MKKLSNRMLASAIILCMIFTMMPMAAHATETTTYTITYTDGVESEEIFADVVYYVAENETVPTYVPPDREGFIFDGWNPNYTATVTADTIFTAKWREHISDGYTVTYTDGVDSEEIFPDMVYEDLSSGDATPVFEGTPTREGFTFAGWNPEVTATVTGDATYTAQWTENAPAHTHDYTAVVTEPTCGERGYTTYTCSCNDSYVSDYVDALDHDWGDYVSIGNGRHTRVCRNDSSHYQTMNCGGRATCHEFAFCPDCKTTYGGYDPKNHSGGTEVRNAKKATETEDGYTGDTYCLGCNVLISEGNIIYATGSGDDDDTHTHNYSYYKFDGTNHWKMCHCGQGQAGSVKPHSLVITRASIGHGEECTVCNYISDVEAHVYSDDSDAYCNECGYRRHVHDRSTAATCISPAKCSCGVTTGSKDSSNHVGGTEIRNAVEATRTEKGYTGDTYCLGCDSMIASGEEIPATGFVAVNIEDDANVKEVTFIPAEGTELPEDAEIIVNPHTPSADDLGFVALEEAPALNVVEDLSDVPVVPHEFDDGTLYGPGGAEYTFYEKLIINGEEYYVNGAHADGRLLLFDKNGDAYWYDGNSLGQSDIGEKVIVPDNESIRINGVVYQIIAKWSGKYALWLDGKPVGAYDRTLEIFFYFNEEYAPDKVKEKQQKSNYLGTVIPGENPIDGLESGKTYNVSVIGSNDIHLEGAENVSGTVTQTFDIPVQLVGNPNVKYAAVHVTNPHAEALEEAFNTWQSMREKLYVATRQYENGEISLEELNKAKQSEMESKGEYRELEVIYDTWEKEHAADNKTGNELGTVTISEDGKTLTATYTVDSFSPFIVYAFVEADEPEIKTLSATIVDDVTEQPANLTWLWIAIAVVAVAGGGFAVYWFVIRKRRKISK